MFKFPALDLLIKKMPDKWPPPPKVKSYFGIHSVSRQEIPKEEVIIPVMNDPTRLLFRGGALDKSASSIADSEDRLRLHPMDSRSPGNASIPAMSLPALSSPTSSKSQGRKLKQDGKSQDKDSAKVAKKQQQGKIDELPKKRSLKPPIRLPRLGLWEYLRVWDVSSNAMRDKILSSFLDEYTSLDPLDFDYFLSKGGSLIFTRFAVGMQLSFQRKKPVAHYFTALGLFIKSLQGERYVYEFAIMGGLISTFEVLRVDEMKSMDKTHAFYFLYRLIDGQGGTRIKYLICSDTSYLESVVDCLTMCKHEEVVTQARNFLQNLCVGNTSLNLFMISKYVISLLPCDFNPRVQAMACRVLPLLIHQEGEIAANCYSLVVDVLRTDYSDVLVDVGELCISIMATSTADDLLLALIEAAQPVNLSDDLVGGTDSYYSLVDNDAPGPEVYKDPYTHDMYFRLQYGAINVLSYMVKNRTEYADWMIEKGVIGSILTAIGTASYTEVQLAAIQLLTLIHELSPDCSLALSYLLPKKFLVVFLNEQEVILQHLTAAMCLVLRQLGHLVQANWDDWFNRVALPNLEPGLLISDEMEGEGAEETDAVKDNVEEIKELVDLLDHMVGDPFSTIVEDMEMMEPDPRMFSTYRDQKNRLSSRAVGVKTEKLTSGEAQIMDDPELEGFRKYLHKDNEIVERVDEFEKYYAAKFTYGSEQGLDMGGMEMAALQDAERAIAKLNEEDQEEVLEETEGEAGGIPAADDDAGLDAELEAAFM